MVVKLLQIKNRTYYFWDDTILITDFESKLLKLVKNNHQQVLLFITLVTLQKRLFTVLIV